MVYQYCPDLLLGHPIVVLTLSRTVRRGQLYCEDPLTTMVSIRSQTFLAGESLISSRRYCSKPLFISSLGILLLCAMLVRSLSSS